MFRDIKKPSQAPTILTPCTASMDKDPQIGDTILHKAGYIIREAVEEGMECAKKEKEKFSTACSDEAQALAFEN